MLQKHYIIYEQPLVHIKLDLFKRTILGNGGGNDICVLLQIWSPQDIYIHMGGLVLEEANYNWRI